MSKAILPTYSICSLTETPHLPADLVTDRFEQYLAAHTDLHFPHKHSFYHLVYFTGGRGKHSIDFVQFPVQAGQIYFMVPGQVHTWDFKGTPQGFIVNFSEQYIQSLITDPAYLEQFGFLQGNAKQQVINIPLSLQPSIKGLLEMIILEGNSTLENKDDMVRTGLLQLFIHIERLASVKKKRVSGRSTILQDFKKLINIHFKEKKLARDYAPLLFVTPNHLNAVSKASGGSSAGELIRNRVLLEAKRLLVNADMRITEIADDLGFEDNSYFTKFFKKYAGTTPEVFRKQVIEK